MIAGSIVLACLATGNPTLPAEIVAAQAQLDALPDPDTPAGQDLQFGIAGRLRRCGEHREGARRFARMLRARRDLDVSRYAAFLLIDEYNRLGEGDRGIALAHVLIEDRQFAGHDPEAVDMLRAALWRSEEWRG
jgi:hypothetical protein